jgi:hypothetical protein
LKGEFDFDSNDSKHSAYNSADQKNKYEYLH